MHEAGANMAAKQTQRACPNIQQQLDCCSDASRPNEMQKKPLPINARIFIVLISAGVLWLWISFLRFRPDHERDFATVVGTLVSAEESISYHDFQKSGHLEIRTRESAIRYCVPEDGYMDYFRREAFFAEVPRGSTIHLSALASDIASSRTFLLNPVRTVFVRGVRVGDRDYCTIQDHIAWQKRDNRWRLGLAVAGTAFLTFIFNRIRRRSETPNTTENAPA